eukprot:gb/GECH01000650.1/.p1 GENE.gb/GECH01000650.1/~~gb/GECH01000650.1/.p1  ORF type:complete len:528 (+),score=108.02 gb/GECH01000650.1/:1-1584(+)
MPRAVHWFRKGLRIHDNPALYHACKQGKDGLVPVFVIDPKLVTPNYVGRNRLKFMLESLEDLDQSLRSLGNRLVVLRGKPHSILINKLKEWNIDVLTFERDTEPYAIDRDKKVTQLSQEHGIDVFTPTSHTLFAPEDIIRSHEGEAPKTYNAFCSTIRNMNVEKPVESISSNSMPSLLDMDELDDHEYRVPTLKELGHESEDENSTSPFKGGETEAIKRLDQYLEDKKQVTTFEKPKGDPTVFDPPCTTVLSPYLKFGCLSSRLFYDRLQDIYRESKTHTKPPVSLLGQLYWREFFYTIGYDTPNFDKMEGNPICKQVDWADLSSDPKDSEHQRELLNAWKEGKTGFPWIDAIMRQLKHWGWMHHLARHCVACFLTRGDLYLSWEAGRDVFKERLIDEDYFLNSANWLWLSGTSIFFHEYWRVYSPVTFAKKYSNHPNYIRHFVPELNGIPDKYILEPWKAPQNVQQKAKCVIGEDYPEPIIDHNTAKKDNMAKLKDVYAKAREIKKRKANAQSSQEPAKKRKRTRK